MLAGLGSTPWTVLSQGIAFQSNISIGWASFFISVVVMLAWIPLKLRLGLGSLFNIVIIAFFLGETTQILSPPTDLISQILFVFFGLCFYGLGTALYLTCHLGAGPRDGLMVGFCQRFHLKVGIVRTSIEVSVCLVGFLLGGTIGIGTLCFAIAIGWIVQIALRLLSRFSQTT